MNSCAYLNKLEKEKIELYKEREQIDKKIYEKDKLIEIYRKKIYLSCQHKWVLDSDYASPYNDKEYYCSICKLYKDHELETIRYTMMMNPKK